MDDLRCTSCGEPITGGYVYHHRLGVYVHGTDECMRDVNGEDIRLHTVRWMSAAVE